ncbi:hemicentin-1-like [Carettochelys insculpta]|uniref:hemicentin-1-like n=1 Tax=Carettochelys insculpta TaxID=44489 RepID=UPI003EBAAB12
MRPAGWVPVALLAAGIVSACQSPGLVPRGDRVIGAAGCTVVFPGPEHIDNTGVVRWDYKQHDNDTELAILVYYVASLKLEILPFYKDRVVFNMSNWSLELKLQRSDQGLYRLRRQEEAKSGKWIRLEVIEPLSELKLSRNFSVVGSTIELVCKAEVGRVDSYQWGKEHEPLPSDDRFQLSRNDSVLHILSATLADAGQYSCKVTNEVSEKEAYLEVTVSGTSAVVSNQSLVGVAVITAVLILGRDRDSE